MTEHSTTDTNSVLCEDCRACGITDEEQVIAANIGAVCEHRRSTVATEDAMQRIFGAPLTLEDRLMAWLIDKHNKSISEARSALRKILEEHGAQAVEQMTGRNHGK